MLAEGEDLFIYDKNDENVVPGKMRQLTESQQHIFQTQVGSLAGLPCECENIVRRRAKVPIRSTIGLRAWLHTDYNQIVVNHT